MDFFGLEITGDHARLLVAVFGGIVASFGFLAGRWSRHRSAVRFKREDLVGSTVVTEYYAIRRRRDGRDELHIVTQGSSEPMDTAFTNAELIHHIKRAVHRHPGLLHLKSPIAHRMMMDEGKDRITGLDAKANLDFLQGRPTRDDEVLFCFAAYKENGDHGHGLHDEVGRLVQMVVSPALIGQMADPAYVAALEVQHAGYRPRCDRLHDFAKEWQRLSALPKSDRSAAADVIWLVTVRTALA